MARKTKKPAKRKAKARAPKLTLKAAPRVADPIVQAPRHSGVISTGTSAPRKRTKAEAELAVAEAYKLLFSSPHGQIVKADLMQWCNVFSPISEADPINLGIRIGERNVALRITQMMGLQPADFPAEAWATAGQLNNMMAGA